MIPKTIHYCWFGHNPLPDLAVKCIASWRKFLPDYEIWEWNEDGSAPQTRALADKYMRFDINVIPYTAEAYLAKKYAFVSDYTRFWILYNYGGIYFDSDVEVIKNMDAILSAGPFMACETNGSDTTTATINPGLGIYASSNNAFYEEILNMYSKMHFLKEDGTQNMTIVVYYVTKLLSKYGLGKIEKKHNWQK